MAIKWGFFFCNCRGTLPLDTEQLVLPVAPAVLFSASDPETHIPEFLALVEEEEADHVLTTCCEWKSRSRDLLGGGARSPEIHSVDVKESCFRAHPDERPAHGKASRLLRAAVETAGLQDEPTYNPLRVGGRVVISGDPARVQRLADRLRDAAAPICLIPPDASNLPVSSSPEWHKGRILEVQGRLGEFRVIIEDDEIPPRQRDLAAAQVVIISQEEITGTKRRTGVHLLVEPSEPDLTRCAEAIRGLVGDFLKPEHVTYNADICAGGSADVEACGTCINVCPYDAIERDAKNHLRIRVDHMACEGCGACASACPTMALRFTEPAPKELYTRLSALLRPLSPQVKGERSTVLFHCGEMGMRVLKEAGQRPLPYPETVLPVEVPCLRYVSEANMLAAFQFGAAGVGLLGCYTCVHGERELLYRNLDFCHMTLDAFGLGRERLRLLTAAEGGEAEAVSGLSSFAHGLEDSPIRWKGRPTSHWNSRAVIAAAIEEFIEQLDREPGQRAVDASQPYAFADVQASGCTMCRSCVNACPVNAFRLDESTSSLKFKPIACVACGLCEKVCPEDVIELRREIFLERDAFDYQTVAQDDMVACSKCGKPYINRKALDTIEAKVLSLESLQDTFTGRRKSILRMCPDCRAVEAMADVEKGWKP